MLANVKTKSQPTIEQKIRQLDQVVEWFYGDNFNLDEALTQYQKAKKLADDLQTDLEKLKNQVEVLADFTKDN